MPTPPINTDETIYTTGPVNVNNGGYMYSYGVSKPAMRAITQKPAGVSTLKLPFEPRPTTGWFRLRQTMTTGFTPLTYWPYGRAAWPNWYSQFTMGSGLNANVVSPRPWNWTLRGQAINGALSKLKDQKIDLSVAFGERAETARFFATNLERVSDLYRDLKRRDKGVWDYMKNFRAERGKTRVSQLPGAWLETQYAVKPLLNDVYGAIDKLNKLERSPNAYFFVVTKSKEENWSDLRERWDFCTYGGVIPLWVQASYQDRAHTSLVYRLKNPLTRELANLGITNPLSSAYELGKFSFVLDWALPVGDYLNLLDADFGWEFLTGSTAVTQKENGRGHHFDNVNLYVDGDVKNVRYSTFSMFREVHSSSPWPVFPPLKNPLSNTTRTTSALALLYSVFGKKYG